MPELVRAASPGAGAALVVAVWSMTRGCAARTVARSRESNASKCCLLLEEFLGS